MHEYQEKLWIGHLIKSSNINYDVHKSDPVQLTKTHQPMAKDRSPLNTVCILVIRIMHVQTLQQARWINTLFVCKDVLINM